MLLFSAAIMIMQLSFLFQQSRITALHMPQSLRSFKLIQRGLVSSTSRNAAVYLRNKNNMMLFSTGTTETPVDAMIAAIAAKGDEIRLLKANKAIKERVMPCVQELLKLKADYLALTGTSFDPIKEDDVRLLKGNKGEKESKPTVVKEKSGKKNDDSQVISLLNPYYSLITPLSHPYHTHATPLSHPYHTLITLSSHPYYTLITPLLHPYHTLITPLLHTHHTLMTPLSSQAKGVESSVITPRDVDYSKW
jgi:hypothetical protein